MVSTHEGTGLPVAVMTVRNEISAHLGKGRCLAWRPVDIENMGTLGVDVCGLKRGHSGDHQAGWSGSGESFDRRWDNDGTFREDE